MRKCEQCGHVGPEVEFVARIAVHPWCEICRKADPAMAKKAYDHMRSKAEYQKMTPEQRREFKNRLEKVSRPTHLPKFRRVKWGKTES